MQKNEVIRRFRRVTQIKSKTNKRKGAKNAEKIPIDYQILIHCELCIFALRILCL